MFRMKDLAKMDEEGATGRPKLIVTQRLQSGRELWLNQTFIMPSDEGQLVDRSPVNQCLSLQSNMQ